MEVYELTTEEINKRLTSLNQKIAEIDGPEVWELDKNMNFIHVEECRKVYNLIQEAGEYERELRYRGIK